MNRLFRSLLAAVGKAMHRPASSWSLNAAVPGFPTTGSGMSFAAAGSGAFHIRRTLAQAGKQWREEWPTAGAGQTRHFRFTRDAPGIWTLTGASNEPAIRFSDLAVAISFAREDAGAAEADIELWADGFYVFVHQTKGWPHRICAPAKRTANRQMKRC
jgi:hypothetical protein